MSRTKSRAATSSAPPDTGRPGAAELAAAAGKSLPDVIAPGLKVLFVGINPGLYSGATGHHFARPGNRFWPALHAAGFTPRRLRPAEKQALLGLGFGITNLVNRTTATAAELDAGEYLAGRRRLAAKVRRYRPQSIAFLGIGAYAQAFGLKQVRVGRQMETFEGTEVWVLPNPSGLNANYQLTDLAALFRALRKSREKAGACRTKARPYRLASMPRDSVAGRPRSQP